MKIIHDAAKNEFALLNDQGEKVGEINYKQRGDQLHVLHTGVRGDCEGRGYAMQLLDALADYAREKNYKLVPFCAYVVSAFKKHPDKYGDVMYKD